MEIETVSDFKTKVDVISETPAEISALLGRLPSAVGYQLNLEAEMAIVVSETVDGKGEVQADTRLPIYRAAPVAGANREILATTGIYPAVDVLESTSTMLQPWIVGQDHYDCAQRVQETLKVYVVAATAVDVFIIAILGLGELFYLSSGWSCANLAHFRKISKLLAQFDQFPPNFPNPPNPQSHLKCRILAPQRR